MEVVERPRARYATKVCPRCGARLYEDMNICYGCLYDFSRDAVPPEEPAGSGPGDEDDGPAQEGAGERPGPDDTQDLTLPPEALWPFPTGEGGGGGRFSAEK